MRPEYLRVEGLHSYRDMEEVHFDELGAFGLFGIFGRTGSGKSSLLDAITLALYGEVERARGRRTGVINHHVDRLHVRFRFHVTGGEDAGRWEVRRTYRAKEGGRTQASRIQLLQETSAGAFVPIVEQEKKVNDRLATLIGLSRQDFQRAVVLPQGRFMEFLRLEGAERRRMMERVFGLWGYGQGLAGQLKRRHQAANDRYRELEGRLAGLAEATPERVLELQNTCADLQARVAEARTRHADLLKRRDAARTLRKAEIELAGATGREAAERDRVDTAVAAEAAGQRTLDTARADEAARGPELEARLRGLEAAMRVAGEHRAVGVAVGEAEAERRGVQQALAASQRRLPELLASADTAAARAEALGKRVDAAKVATEERDRARAATRCIELVHGALRDHQRDAAALARRDERLAELERVRVAQDTDHAAAAAALAPLREALALADQALVDADPDALLHAERALAARARDVERWTRLERELTELDATILAASEAQAEGRTALAGLETQLHQAEGELVRAQQALDAARHARAAHELAAALVDGEDCPVCGAHEHPRPAGEAPDLGPLEAPLVAARARVDTHRRAHAVAAARLDAGATTLAGHDQAAARLRTELEALAGLGEDPAAALADARTAHAARVEAAGAARKAHEAARAAFREAEERARSLAGPLEATRRTLAELGREREREAASVAEARAAVAAAEAALAPHTGGATLDEAERWCAEVRERLASWQDLVGQLNDAVGAAAKARAEHEAAVKADADAAARLAELTTLVAERRARLDELADALRVQLPEGDLGDAGERLATAHDQASKARTALQAATAKARTAQAALAEALAGARSALASARADARRTTEARDTAKAAWGAEPLPPEGALDAACEAAQQTRADLDAALGAATEALRKTRADLETRQDVAAEAAERSRELARLDQLKALLRGNTFVEYVATDLLAAIVEDASVTLSRLTHDRYALELDDDGSFLVRDAHAGLSARHVSTLSGGETFLSALSLALALSAHVQRTGARPLDFFFLDEGFGSLDEQSLDQVMSALEALNDGTRMLGVISHMPVVKERLGRYLVVHPATPDGRGSRLELVNA